jgi:D-glycero-D-manno-heptose 1,7-bisphosphate phosphatase
MVTTKSKKGQAWPIVAPGIWLDIRVSPLAMPRPALFLDRDGVIVHDTGYLSDPAKVALVPGTAALIRAANAVGVPVLVVTNQSGIDRGLLDWVDFAAVEARIADLLAAAGATTDATAACPFHPDHTAGYDKTHARWRKPGPGMITALADRLKIDLPGSWLIGDQLWDIEAARNAGLAGGILTGDPIRPDRALELDNLAQSGFTPHAARSADAAMALLKPTILFDNW